MHHLTLALVPSKLQRTSRTWGQLVSKGDSGILQKARLSAALCVFETEATHTITTRNREQTMTRRRSVHRTLRLKRCTVGKHKSRNPPSDESPTYYEVYYESHSRLIVKTSYYEVYYEGDSYNKLYYVSHSATVQLPRAADPALSLRTERHRPNLLPQHRHVGPLGCAGSPLSCVTQRTAVAQLLSDVYT